jgi:hypothetical protein
MPWQKQSAPVADMSPVDGGKKSSYEAPVVPEPGLQLSTEQRFKDIPLPMGLKEDLDRTFVYESSALQVGRMVYTSRGSIYDLTQFFLRECPTAGWKLQTVLESERGKTAVFTKPGKRLEVSVLGIGMPQGRRVTLTLTPEAGAASGL